jgi:hypothetical protein
MRTEENATKNGEPTVGFSFTTMLQSVLIKNFLEKIEVTTLEHPEHSRDLALADFHLFPRLKLTLTGWRFCNATDIINNATEQLEKLSQKGFQRYFQHLYSR